MSPSRREPMTAEELVAKLANDAEYQAVKAQQEYEREERARVLEAAEAPLLKDLAEVGYSVNSVWDLGNTGDPYPEALPVLVDHLTRDYPSDILEGIARLLAVKSAAFAWPVLKEQFILTSDEDFKDGLAAALAQTVTPKTGEELLQLVRDPRHGSSRILLLRGLRVLGTERRREVLTGLLNDDVLKKQASWMLKRRRRTEH